MKIGAILVLVAAVTIDDGLALKCFKCHYAWKQPLDDGANFTDTYYDPKLFHKDCFKLKLPEASKSLQECPSEAEFKTSNYVSTCKTFFISGPIEGIIRTCETVKKEVAASAPFVNKCKKATTTIEEGVMQTECACNVDGCMGDGKSPPPITEPSGAQGGRGLLGRGGATGGKDEGNGTSNGTTGSRSGAQNVTINLFPIVFLLPLLVFVVASYSSPTHAI